MNKNILVSFVSLILLAIMISMFTINHNYNVSLKSKDKEIQELKETNNQYEKEIQRLNEELKAEKNK